MYSVKIGLSFFVILTWSGCSDDDCGSPPPVPVVSWDQPVIEGQNLVITARGGEENTYRWLGPEGFQEEGRIQELQNVQRRNSGDYSVMVSEGDCPSVTNTVFIEVEPLPRFCETTANELELVSPEIQNMSYSSVNCSTDDTINLFTILASGELQGAKPCKTTIIFPERQLLLIDRSYDVVRAQNLLPDQVSIAMHIHDGTREVEYQGAGGKLFLRVSGNGVNVQFCDLSLNDENATEILATGNIRCTF